MIDKANAIYEQEVFNICLNNNNNQQSLTHSTDSIPLKYMNGVMLYYLGQEANLEIGVLHLLFNRHARPFYLLKFHNLFWEVLPLIPKRD
jgi:hypothetical protein